MKSIMIDDKKIRFNKDKPISKVLQKKLVSIKNTNEYRSYALNKAKDTLSDGRVRNLLTKHAKWKSITYLMFLIYIVKKYWNI